VDRLSENHGQWEGQGGLETGMKWSIYVRFQSKSAEVVSPDDGCEADWAFGTVTDGVIRGWEHVTVARIAAMSGESSLLRAMMTTN